MEKKLRHLKTTGISCKVSVTAVKDVEKFIQTVCYSVKEEGNFTETRVRLGGGGDFSQKREGVGGKIGIF